LFCSKTNLFKEKGRNVMCEGKSARVCIGPVDGGEKGAKEKKRGGTHSDFIACTQKRYITGHQN